MSLRPFSTMTQVLQELFKFGDGGDTVTVCTRQITKLIKLKIAVEESSVNVFSYGRYLS